MKRLHAHVILIFLMLTLICTTQQVKAHHASYYAPASALASGHWARVRITGHGIHQITYRQLQDLGFENPSEVKVCGFGSNLLSDNLFTTARPDDVKATPCLHTSDGRLLFYGEPDVRATISEIAENGTISITRSRNVYSSDTYYLLTDAPIPAATPTNREKLPAGAVTLTNHLSVELYEPEEENPGKGGASFFSKQCEARQKLKMPFRVSNFDPSGPAYLGVRAVAAEYTISGSYQLTLSYPSAFKATQVSKIAFNFHFDKNYLYDIRTGGYALSASNTETGITDGTYNFTLNWPSTNNLEYGALDYAWLAYTRRNIIDRSSPGGLLMQIVGSGSPALLVIDRADADALVWDVTDAANVTALPCRTDADTLKAVSARTDNAMLLAFNPSDTHLPVEIAGTIDNQNIHGMDVPHMVIITTDRLYDAACELADIHRRHDGIDVAVLTQRSIFNEFGGGNASAMAYRRMVKMFHDRDPQRLRYVMLYGASSWDNRGITGEAPYERLLCYEVEPVGAELTDASRHSILNFVTDDYFGMVDDDFDPAQLHRTHVQLAVGRVPFESEAQARLFNSKTDAYLSNMPGADVASRALLISDNGDRNGHMQQAETLGATMLTHRPELTLHRAYVSLYPLKGGIAAEARKVVSSALIKGVGYFSYTGHGRPTSLSAESVWSQYMTDNTSYSCPPIGVFSTCDTYELDRNTPGLAEMMVKRLNGGTIASVAATRSVFLDYNIISSKAMARAYASARPGATVGDIYREAHNMAIDSTPPEKTVQALFNTMCFNLCGDPALRITVPGLKARVTEINGTDVSAANDSAEPIDVEPMTLMHVQGDICAADGATDASFNGTAIVTLYDGARTVPVIKHVTGPTGDMDENVTLDESTLATTTVNVTDGRWEALLPVPFGISQATRNRLVVTATEHASATPRAAAGLFSGVHVTSDSPHTFSGDAPVITDFFINSPEFNDGDIVDADFGVYAVIRLGSGGLSKTDAIGGAGRLILDGKRSIEGADGAISINADGTATMNMRLTGLDDGRHTLTLSVADFTGHRVSSTIAFTVMTHDADNTPALTLSHHIARTDVTVSLESEAQYLTSRLIVRDVHGNTVYSIANPVFPLRWNLNDNNGTPVPDGRYTLSATMATPDGSFTSTPATTLTIIH